MNAHELSVRKFWQDQKKKVRSRRYEMKKRPQKVIDHAAVSRAETYLTAVGFNVIGFVK